MENVRHILIVEDERVTSNFLKAALSQGGYATICAMRGKEALALNLSHNPDLILLNLGLPDIDGMEVLCNIREWSDVPIIIVSSRSGEHDKVAALDAGANDYVTKPFGSAELLARMRAALRHHKKFLPESQSSSFSNGELSIDYASRRVFISRRAVHLTPIEFKITVLMSKNLNKVLTHDYILHCIWGPNGGDSQTLRVNVANIRKKLEPNPSVPTYIVTEPGVGYMMPELGG